MVVDFDLQADIHKLIEYDALEIYLKDIEESGKVYIPYMMNDAVECYILLSKCSIMGEWDKDISAKDFSVTHNGNKNGLIIRQKNKNTISIWFEECQKIIECYQYHRIGHFWVKGQEEWRRLVYIIGTMHDKYSFMGDRICNDIEHELMFLMEFPVFRYWTPIDESLDEYYPTTTNGSLAIKQIAEKINDKAIDKLIVQYDKAVQNNSLTYKKVEKFAKQLMKSKALYYYLNQQIDRASLSYQPRKYSDDEQEQLNRLRVKSLEKYLDLGYTGAYPELLKDNQKVIFYEEHPYVMREFEYEDFDFKIHELFLKL